MKKRLISILTVIMILAANLPVCVFAEIAEIITEQEDICYDEDAFSLMATKYTYENLTYTISSKNTITITDCSTSATEVDIPSEIDEIKVTAIGNAAFDKCTKLTRLTIPEGVVSLGGNIIRGTAITSITIPSTVTTASIVSSNGPLAGAEYLTEVIFAQGTTKIPKNICAVSNQVSSIERVVIPEGTISIGDYAFSGCSALEELEIPEGVTSLGCSMAAGTGITEITIPSTVTSSGNSGSGVSAKGALAGTENLTKVIFADGMAKLPNYICAGAENISEFEIPSSVTAIGDYAFSGCSAVDEFVIPENVTTLGSCMLAGTSVTEITVPAVVTASGNVNKNGAFAGAGQLTAVVFAEGTTKIPNYICASNSYESYICDIVIPDGVEAIGNYAFYKCAGFDGEIDIPETVKTIGSYSFQGCSNLKSVVTNYNDADSWSGMIGNYAFADCKSLSNVTIAASIKTIGQYAFSACSSLTSLDIPEGVTKLDYYAIAGTGITSITLPSTLLTSGYNGGGGLSSNGALAGAGYLSEVIFAEGTTKIPNYICASYSQQSNIRRIVIPDTVETIGTYAFYKCIGLDGTVNIPRSVKTIGQSAFQGCTRITGLKINYNDTARWSSIIGSYAFADCTALTDVALAGSVKTIGAYAFSGCSTLSELIIPEGVTALDSYALAGTAISALTIPSTLTKAADSTTAKGSLEGMAYLSEVTFAEGTKKIASGICASYSQLSSIERVYIPPTVSEVGIDAFYQCENITIYGEEGSYANQYATENNIPFVAGEFEYEQPMVPVDKVYYIKSVSMQRSGGNYNVLTMKQQFEKDSAEEVVLEVDIDWRSSAAGKVVLIQNGKEILEAENGRFVAIVPGECFDAHGMVYIAAIDKNGKTLEKRRVYIQVTEPENTENTFEIIDKLSFEVDADKPVIGSEQIDIDLGKVRGIMETDESAGTFRFAAGDYSLSDDAEWEKFKEAVKDAKRRIENGANPVLVTNMLKNKGLADAYSDKAVILGYAEGIIENGKAVPVEGGLIVNAALSYSDSGQTIVEAAPVYYTVGTEGRISAALDVAGMSDDCRPLLEGTISIEQCFEAGEGLGIASPLLLRTRGQAVLTVNIDTANDSKEASVIGSEHFELMALDRILYKKDIDENEWQVYDNVPKTAELMSAYTNKDQRVIQSGVYADTQPQMMEADGVKVMFWTTNNTSRTSENSSMLVYSVYIDTFDTWSDPRPVMDNGMSDFYPSVGDGYVVWQKANRVFEDGVSLAEISGASEIYIAEFDGTGFGVPVRLTDNDVLDYQPKVAADGDKITVVWTQNTDNDIEGCIGRNSICKAEYDGSTWGEITTVAENLNTIPHITTGYAAGSAVTAYELDCDNDAGTINDREIYIIRNGGTERLTDNDSADLSPVIKKLNGNTALFWYSENNIYYITDFENRMIGSVSVNPPQQLTDRYSVVSNDNSAAVLWTAVNNGVSEVHGVLYDGAQWSGEVTLTQTGQSARYPDGLIDANGKMFIGFNRTDNIADGNYYKYGQSDLCVTGISAGYDISISDVYTIGKLKPEENLPLYFTVSNTGETPITRVSADVLGINGEQNTHFDYDVELMPGEAVELSGYYTAGEEVSAGNIAVRLGISEGNEHSRTNNIAAVHIGGCDIEITGITERNYRGKHIVSMKLKNSGYTSAEGVIAGIYAGNGNGEVLFEKSVGELAPAAEAEIIYEVDTAAMTESFSVLFAQVQSSSAEDNYGNNSQGFIVDKNLPEQSWDYEVNGINSGDGTVTVHVNKISENEGRLFVAVYDENDRVTALTFRDVNETADIELQLDTENAAYIRVFVWSKDMMPLSNMVKENI